VSNQVGLTIEPALGIGLDHARTLRVARHLKRRK
jgi:hypothetical protein